MALPQQKYRELVFQMLYGYEQGAQDDEAFRRLMMKELQVSKSRVREAQDRVRLVQAQREPIDKLLRETSSAYDLHRIHTVEQSILRLGVYELLFDDEIPPKVAISEALRLARKFSSPEAGRFVNAVLDAIYRASEGESVDEAQIAEAATSLLEEEERVERVLEEDDEDRGGELS